VDKRVRERKRRERVTIQGFFVQLELMRPPRHDNPGEPTKGTRKAADKLEDPLAWVMLSMSRIQVQLEDYWRTRLVINIVKSTLFHITSIYKRMQLSFLLVKQI
jgi:hypothetical protein